MVDDNNDGIMPFTFKPDTKVKVGDFVTATAPYDETSEFSAPKKVRKIHPTR